MKHITPSIKGRVAFTSKRVGVIEGTIKVDDGDPEPPTIKWRAQEQGGHWLVTRTDVKGETLFSRNESINGAYVRFVIQEIELHTAQVLAA